VNEYHWYDLRKWYNSGLVWGAGTVLGPVVGGGFEKYNWRFAFYINLFIGALMGPGM
jgi:MFS family permease